ncbi:hypothetical protein A9K65_013470 [Mesorhizobium sp. WSM1497]|nr:hypothetical protein A9K65_013470 [Mesorhizobium sp. WSM1497]ESX79976.1 hypothetical protein X757_02895 [Mesorhizobium sp. LSHC414A00]
MRPSPGQWLDVVNLPSMKVRPKDKVPLLAALNANFNRGPVNPAVDLGVPTLNGGLLKRLLRHCPCLHNQIAIGSTARAVVHFCELTLGCRIDATNVHQAFLIQHPKKGPPLDPPPLKRRGDGGTIMEFLCSEVLRSAGIPPMDLDSQNWPEWKMPGHMLLNEGKMNALRAFGDILIPCAPTNLVISVKSEAARERLLYSSNAIEGIGFGFFREPDEFWTESRMALYKRMGFTAIYMPDHTHEEVIRHIRTEGTERHAVNINGTDLYRPLSIFGTDMRTVVGRSSMLL